MGANTWTPFFSIVSPAHADPARADEWTVPSLETLHARRAREDIVGMGFTEFHIRSTPLAESPADAFTYGIAVNGQPIRIDGLRLELLSQPIGPDRRLSLRFGLENLNFAGVHGGCDVISVAFQLLEKGRSVGEPFTLSRSYVALRDALALPRRPQQGDGDDRRAFLGKERAAFHWPAAGIDFTWTGKYRRPTPSWDFEVFVQSIFVRAGASPEKIAATRDAMARLRGRAIRFVRTDEQVKALALGDDAVKPEDRARVRRMIFRDRALTFAVRPPLEKPMDSGEKQGFGLAAALTEETGQVRFTFTREEARALKAHVISLGANRYVISPDSFVYTANKSYQSLRDVCDGM